MKAYVNSKIKTKLILFAMIMALISVIIGIIGAISINMLRQEDQIMYDENIIPLGKLAALYDIIGSQRVRASNMVIFYEADPEFSAAETKKLAEKEADFEEMFAAYRQTIVSPEELAIYEAMEEAYFVVFAPIKTELRRIVAAGDTAAMPDIITQVNKMGSLISGYVDEAVELNITVAANKVASNQNLAAMARIVQAAAIVVGLAITVLCAFYISGLISKPLMKITSIAKKLAAGDTNIEVKSLNRKDEIGELSESFNLVINALKELNHDAGMLVEAANEGRLSIRADAAKHQGDYRKIVEGVNETLEAVIGPVRIATSVLEQMSIGNLNVCVEGSFKGDHALIQNALNDTIANITSYIDQIKNAISTMASGDFRISITSDFKGDFIELKDAINSISDSLSDVMRNINIASDQVAAGTQQVSDANQTASQGATKQANAIEELTATVAEIADQVRQTSENANGASQEASSTREYATEGIKQMQQMQQAMQDINTSAANISKIIKVIDDIAFQTNILALNAAVEAARAGVHGKGFAVVAEEVRNLATKCADAANETTDLIEGSINKVKAGTKIADETAESLTKIADSVGKSVEALRQIAKASTEQATGVAQVNMGIEQMSQVVQTNATTSEESAAASEELMGQADMLKQLVSQFKLKDSHNERTPSLAPRLLAIPDYTYLESGDAQTEDFGKY